jgi:UDP-glucose 4-epimerase
MHVLVTGGAGFIGSHTVEALLQAGARVRVLDNLSSGKRINLPAHERLQLMEADVRDPGAVHGAMHGVTHVLHLAAQVSVRASLEDPPHSASHNIAGFLNVLDAVRLRAGVRLVYASSAAVYGMPERLPLSEEAPCRPSSPYGLEKLVDDQYGALYHSLYGTRVMGLRYFNVYGPRQDPTSPYAGVISRFVQRLVAGEPLTVFGDGTQTRDFVYVADVARANVAALATDHCGVVNVGTGASVSLLQLIEALGRCAQTAPRVHFDGPVPGDIRDSAMRPDRMGEVLGFVPATPLAEGLSALLATVRAADPRSHPR